MLFQICGLVDGVCARWRSSAVGHFDSIFIGFDAVISLLRHFMIDYMIYAYDFSRSFVGVEMEIGIVSIN